ncbi:MAG: hypothetical protein FWF50_00330 [Defluviitaleaceae bacterium]|nr:hypothetical protein [Defluviitaleaceae bacterium]
MNGNTVEKNYSTQINFMSKSADWNSERFNSIYDKLNKGLDDFKSLLSDELKEEFKKLQNLYKEYNFIYAHEEFCHGIYLATGVSRRDLKDLNEEVTE